MQLFLNAALEEEAWGGPSNGSIATAQDINDSFLSLGLHGSRGGVVGIGDRAVGRLFAVPYDGSDQIVELDPVTGAEINRFDAPDHIIAEGGADGLAFDGSSLFYINGDQGRRTLWELDPNTGAVIDADSIGYGTGWLNGLAALGKVYILELADKPNLLATCNLGSRPAPAFLGTSSTDLLGRLNIYHEIRERVQSFFEDQGGVEDDGGDVAASCGIEGRAGALA
jgi:hypothetical protein